MDTLSGPFTYFYMSIRLIKTLNQSPAHASLMNELLPCFSTSGTVTSDTLVAERQQLYKMQIIQIISPTMLVLSNEIFESAPLGKISPV